MKKIATIFGYGYVTKFLIPKLIDLDYQVYCVSRKKIEEEINQVEYIKFGQLDKRILFSDIILSSVPSNQDEIDPVLNIYKDLILDSKAKWIGYLSSTSVYGNHNGGWVTEESECKPTNPRSKARFLAERQWYNFSVLPDVSLNIFRLSAIYGPGRNISEQIKNGKDFTIVKKNHYFSRIHVEDICRTIIASIKLSKGKEIYNVSDDKPAPLHIVQQYAARKLGFPPLKEISIEEANILKMLHYFFNDNKKVSNDKIKEQLKVNLCYSSYMN